MGNLKRRLERLEGGRQGRGVYFIFLQPGEDEEEVLQKHRAQRPKNEKDAVTIIFQGSDQDPPSAPPPPRPEAKEPAKAPGPAPLQIIR